MIDLSKPKGGPSENDSVQESLTFSVRPSHKLYLALSHIALTQNKTYLFE